jgi:hypothetical protein
MGRHRFDKIIEWGIDFVLYFQIWLTTKQVSFFPTQEHGVIGQIHSLDFFLPFNRYLTTFFTSSRLIRRGYILESHLNESTSERGKKEFPSVCYSNNYTSKQ